VIWVDWDLERIKGKNSSGRPVRGSAHAELRTGCSEVVIPGCTESFHVLVDVQTAFFASIFYRKII